MFKLAVKSTAIVQRNLRAELKYRANLLPSRTNPNRIQRFLFVAALSFLAGCPTKIPTADRQETAVSQSNSPADLSRLSERIDGVLNDNLKNRRLSTDIHGAWQILHGVLAYGPQFTIQSSQGEVNALDYLLRGGTIKGFELRSGDRFEVSLTPEYKGEGTKPKPLKDDPLLTRGIRTELDPGAKLGQGHRDQWLAYLAACNLPIDQEIRTLDGPRRVDLWLRQIEWDIPLNFEREYSWTLMSLVPYRESTHRWTARDGQDYSIESLLRSEIDRLSPESACGGSHRLVGIAIALNKRKSEGQATKGVWEDAQTLVDSAIQQTIEYQNADGTFSCNYFERPGWSLDIASAIGSTGHTLEFIAVGASDKLLTDPKIMKAAASLCRLLEQSAGIDLECGAIYHALSGLQIYRKRIATIAST